jgi:hypothetical protein
MPEVTAQVLAPAGYVHYVHGSGPTIGDANEMVVAKLAIVIGDIVSYSVTDAMTTIEEALINFGLVGDADGCDANLTLVRPGLVDGKLVTRNLHITDMTTTLKGVGGKVDLTEARVQSVATNFFDGDGNGDYILRSGRFQKKFSKRGTRLKRRRPL